MLAAYELALVVFSWFHDSTFHFTTGRFDWGLPLSLAAIVVTFLVLGLYKLEAYVSRPLHLAVLAKGTVVALVITAFFEFTFKMPFVSESRLTVFSTFLAFFVLDAAVRLLFVELVYEHDIRVRRGGTLVLGDGVDSSYVVARCRELRGFAPVKAVEALDKRRNGYDAEPALLQAVAAAEPAPRQVFLDTSTLGHKAVFDLIEAARRRGCEVYVVGRLANALDTTHLLLRLFEMPVMRVRRVSAGLGRPTRAKRAFDVAVSAVALILLAPLFAVLAVLVKRDSPGPVFFRQARLGLHGEPFEFLKFRTMTVDNDDSAYREHMLGRIGSDPWDTCEPCACDEYGRPVFKLVEDDRVTRFGRFLRKYSLDELPQFWNVLRGDMSIVGPRPGLDYEVAAYKPWHHRRLDLMPGVSGLWQVSGRSRVSFDEMVFQDVVYSYSQSLMTDVSLCLRTIPAMLNGRGAT